MLKETTKLTAAPMAAMVMVLMSAAYVTCMSKTMAVPVSVPDAV